ncbi:hypothetical protein ACN20G_08780 [Streptomyces sp. BI20]|uniref:hypothetical protein n=1 Tax=Streptomyces sp. BI20 TaxID=3403460 RepID=UPI003C74B40C
MDHTTGRSRRMRSGAVVLGGMGLLAATLVACGSDDEPDKRCVDPKTMKQLPDYECKSGGSRGGSGGVWYYGGGSSSGKKVSGGSFDKSKVSRGGIGKSSGGKSSGG